MFNLLVIKKKKKNANRKSTKNVNIKTTSRNVKLNIYIYNTKNR